MDETEALRAELSNERAYVHAIGRALGLHPAPGVRLDGAAVLDRAEAVAAERDRIMRSMLAAEDRELVALGELDDARAALDTERRERLRAIEDVYRIRVQLLKLTGSERMSTDIATEIRGVLGVPEVQR